MEHIPFLISTAQLKGEFCNNLANGKYVSMLLWKEAQQKVRQHWFLYSYIAAYIQALYVYCPVLLEYIRLV
jgi:hypothetical protein